jgi:hypothetical protein
VPSDKGMSSGLILVLGPRLGKGRDDALNASSSHVQELPADVSTPSEKNAAWMSAHLS